MIISNLINIVHIHTKYILSIATALILTGAGCASTPAAPPTESPATTSPVQIEESVTTTPDVPPSVTTKPAVQPTPTPTKPAVTAPVADPVVTPPPATPTVKSYTMTEVSAANTESNCLTVINGTVYNLTAFINKHPGGDRNILRICGKDGTSAFSGQHGGESKPENMLATFDVGVLTQ